jgi:MFS family permease
MSRSQLHDRAPLVALYTANAISQVGNMMTSVAIPWFVLQTTGSAMRTGITTFALTLPLFIAGFVGGGLVDRLSPRRMSIVSDLLGAATVAAIPLLYALGWLSYPLLLLLVFLTTILDTPGSTARQSILPDLIARAGTRPERANAIYQAIFRCSIFLGPPLAGVLIVLIDTANVLWIDSATFVISALIVGLLVPGTPPRPQPHSDYLGQIGAGVRHIRHDSLLLALLAIFSLVDLLANSLILVVVPVYAAQIFDSSIDYGVVLSSFGGGMLAGTLAYGALSHWLPRRLTLALSLLLSSLPVIVLAATPGLAVTTVLFAVMGFALGPSATLTMTAFQQRTPPELRGRVFGARLAIQTASIPLGALITGALLEAFGLAPAIVAIAIPYLLTCAAPLVIPAMRLLDAPAGLVATAPEGGHAETTTEGGHAGAAIQG